MGIHDKHRERMRQRLMESEGRGFSGHELLEMLLYYAIPRGDTNPQAHALTDKFGGLKGVLDAAPDELKKVAGVGDRSVSLLKLVQRIAAEYAAPDEGRAPVMCDSAAAGAYLVPRFMGLREEAVFMLCLDGRGRLLGCCKVHQGSINSADVNVRRIAEMAIAQNAVGIIISHNHPSGVALPSADDRATTAALKNALAPLNITLLDHIIVAGSDFVSMSDSGLI